LIFNKIRIKGEIELLERRWLSGTCRMSGTMGKSSELELKNFASVFVLIGGGFIIGLILLFAECVYYRFGRRAASACNYRDCSSLISSV